MSYIVVKFARTIILAGSLNRIQTGTYRCIARSMKFYGQALPGKLCDQLVDDTLLD